MNEGVEDSGISSLMVLQHRGKLIHPTQLYQRLEALQQKPNFFSLLRGLCESSSSGIY